MVKLDPFLIFELLKNVTFCTQKKNINHPLFSLTLIHSLTAKKKYRMGRCISHRPNYKSRARFARSQFVYIKKVKIE